MLLVPPFTSPAVADWTGDAEGWGFSWLQVTTEEQRTKFTEQLTEMEDWLYMEGEAEGATEFKAKLKLLKDVGDPMKQRAQASGYAGRLSAASLCAAPC